jgi:hypothetical protein
MDLANFLLGLVLNLDLPDVHLLSSWDYRSELLHPVRASISKLGP